MLKQLSWSLWEHILWPMVSLIGGLLLYTGMRVGDTLFWLGIISRKQS